MVTTPLVEEAPELTPSWPELALNFTVAPETARLLASTTVAVMVVEFVPSALIEAADEARITAAAGPEVGVVVPPAGGTVTLPAAPPPPPHPVNPSRSANNVVAKNVCAFLVNMAIPIEGYLPDPSLDLLVDNPRGDEIEQFLS